MVRLGMLVAGLVGIIGACQAVSAPGRAAFPALTEAGPPPSGDQTAVFAGGCFWGVEGVFETLKGVKSAVSGYSGGHKDHPTYDEVSSGNTGHAESVEVTYDPQVISYPTLLKVFFSVVQNPTELNYQGPDHGTQYRSAVFFKTPQQQSDAQAYIDALTKAKVFSSPIVTEVTKFQAFWPAEDYHQHFLQNNPSYPYIVAWDLPKLHRLSSLWPELVATSVSKATWHGLPVYSPDQAISFPIVKTDSQWHSQLSALAYEVLRNQGTEQAGTGPLLNEHRKGIFYSAATGEPLFRSQDKFESGTGWPSFTQPISQANVVLRLDDSMGMERVEVEDSASGSHLGHVFDDGPAPTGLRYCMDSASLLFVADGDTPPPIVQNYHR